MNITLKLQPLFNTKTQRSVTVTVLQPTRDYPRPGCLHRIKIPRRIRIPYHPVTPAPLRRIVF
eukprot:scaffold1444_cov134-Isochrysis_galbana.AAC.8